MKRLRNGARTEGEELLTRVLDECLEEDLSFVPHEREIAGKHRFSPGFEEQMEAMMTKDAGKGIKEAFPFPMGTTGGMCCSVLCMWSIGRNCVSAAQRRQRERGYHGNDDSRKCRRCRRECRT